MSENSSKWLKGCGIGCGSIILIIFLLMAGGYFFIKDKVEFFEEIDASNRQLEDRYGEIRDYTPEADGEIDPARLEAFLTVRDNTAGLRTNLSRAVDRLSGNIEDVEDEGDTFWNVWGLVSKGVGIIPQIVEFYKERNQGLLDVGMGLGEYYYIYITAYVSWLEKPLEDGPKFPLMGGKSFRNFDWHEFDQEYRDYDDFGKDVRTQRRDQLTRKIRRIILRMMRRQLDELEDRTNYDSSWFTSLSEEIEKIEDDQDRLPWQDGLPDQLIESLSPFRERFENSYSSMLNSMELN